MWLQSPQDGLTEKWCPELQPLLLSRGRESQVEAGSTPSGGQAWLEVVAAAAAAGGRVG